MTPGQVVCTHVLSAWASRMTLSHPHAALVDLRLRSWRGQEEKTSVGLQCKIARDGTAEMYE